MINELRCNFAKLTQGVTNFYAKLELDNTFAQQHIFAAYNTETDTPGYSLLNARIGFKNEGITIFLWSRNLTNTNYFEQLLPGAGNAGHYAAVVGDPVTYGITLKTTFR